MAPNGTSSGQHDIFGQADLWSDVTPQTPNVPTPIGPLDAPTPVQASSGQEWYYFRLA